MTKGESDKINIFDFMYTAKKNFIPVLCIILLLTIAGFMMPKQKIDTQYRLQKEVLVNECIEIKRFNNKNNEIIEYKYEQAGEKLLEACVELFKTDTMLKRINERIQPNSYSIADLSKMIDINRVSSSDRFLTIKITSKDEGIVKKLSNVVVDVYNENASKLLKSSVVELTVLSSYDEPTEISTSDNSNKTVAIFFVVGVAIAGLYVLLKYLLDDSIKRIEDVENISKDTNPIIHCDLPKCRGENMSFELDLKLKNPHVINIIGFTDDYELVADALAESYLEKGETVVILNANVRNESNNKKDDAYILNENKNIDEVLSFPKFKINKVQLSKKEYCSVDIFKLDKMKKVLDKLKNNYTKILIISSSLDQYCDGYSMASLSEATLLYVKMRQDNKTKVAKSLEMMRSTNCDCGIIVID